MGTALSVLGRTGRRTLLGVLGAAVIVLLPSAAQAHVTVQPAKTEGGSFSVVAFRVPDERDDTATVKLRVILPENQPVASVSTTNTPGWRVTTRTRKLEQPLDQEGRQITDVVSEVTWTATGKGIQPGQFEDFELSMGPLPESGQMVFKALQTYDDGEQVDWNEVAIGDAEPEHPAPVLTLADPARPADDDEPVLPLVLSGLALVVALAAFGVSWRRARK